MESITETLEMLFGKILWQESWPLILLLLTIGFLVKFLPFRFPKVFGNEKVFAFINFIAALMILVGAINLGYKASDNDWAREEVTRQKQEQVQKLQDELRQGR